jgi:hypothetical protein
MNNIIKYFYVNKFDGVGLSCIQNIHLVGLR